MSDLRARAGLYASVQDVSDLLQEICKSGADSGRDKVELVGKRIFEDAGYPVGACKAYQPVFETRGVAMAVITDPISDMLTRIRNAVHVRHESVRMPASKLKVSIAKIMREEGYIKYFKVVRAGSVKRNPKAGDKRDARPLAHNLLIIYLKYGPGGENVINGLKRISRPGLRRYVSCSGIPWVLGGMGITIVSTNQGVMSGREARKRKAGGEVVCNVW